MISMHIANRLQHGILQCVDRYIPTYRVIGLNSGLFSIGRLQFHECIHPKPILLDMK